ncbi:hypothetical protein C8F04DRAFT_1399966 [Mycena alexandri]|uniref:Uncharacterized protein n=1 Tax=Mycena alexandri TaxID=1745969 RepID=A0AAD6SEN7_9AGAR|nr:hypothetical protein C8F04DRAFT_1399966 [Mycena alexandri]
MRFLWYPSARFRVKHLFSTPETDFARIAVATAVELLPGNVYQEIAGHLCDLRNVLNVGLTVGTSHAPTTEFPDAPDAAPHLRSFILTKVHASGDNNMTNTADSWLTSTGIWPKHVGTYTVLRDAAGAPIALTAHEWGFQSFGLNHYSRRFRSTIPAHAPQRRPSLMRLGRSRSSISAHSSTSNGSTPGRA